MIRFAQPPDLPAAIRLMQAAKMGAATYRYGTMDGLALLSVDDDTGALNGYVRFHLGRPETHLRQLVVDPAAQTDGLVAKALLAKVVEIAAAHGSQGVEAFLPERDVERIDRAQRAGCQLDRGVRLRWLVGQDADREALR